jgi:hypothetical protein
MRSRNLNYEVPWPELVCRGTEKTEKPSLITLYFTVSSQILEYYLFSKGAWSGVVVKTLRY